MTTTANCAVSVVPLAPAHIDACERIAREAFPGGLASRKGLQELRHLLETEEGWVSVANEEPIGFLTMAPPFP